MAGMGTEGSGDGGFTASFCLYDRHAVSISLPVVRHTFSVLIITRGYVKTPRVFLFIEGRSYRQAESIVTCSHASLDETICYKSIKSQFYT